MAIKNAKQNRLAVELLDIQPPDQVLEIGFGPGSAIYLMASQATRGFIAGVDHSEVMMEQAARRNRGFIEGGRVELRQGSISALPYPDGRFTKVLDVNCFHHWPSPEAGLKEVQRVLRPGALLLLCLRMKHPTRTFLVSPGYTKDEVQEVLGVVRRAGFRDVRAEVRQAGREIRCLLATR